MEPSTTSRRASCHDQRLRDRWVGPAPEGYDEPGGAHQDLAPLIAPPGATADSARVVQRQLGIRDKVSIPVSLEAAHDALTMARAVHAALAVRLADAERAVASAREQLSAAIVERDELETINAEIEAEQVQRVASGLPYQLSPELAERRRQARDAADKVEDLAGVLDTLETECQVSRDDASAAGEWLIEAAVAVIGVEVRDELFVRLRAARAAEAEAIAEIEGATQWFGDPLGRVPTKRIRLGVLGAEMRHPDRKPARSQIEAWREKFAALISGDG